MIDAQQEILLMPEWATNLLALSLGATPIVIGVAGFFAFLNIKADAKRQAETTAKDVCTELAEKHTNLYLQNNLPSILKEYSALFKGAVTDAEADAIAEAQD